MSVLRQIATATKTGQGHKTRYNAFRGVPTPLGYLRRGTASALCVFDLKYVLCQRVRIKVPSDTMHTVPPVMGGRHEVMV